MRIFATTFFLCLAATSLGDINKLLDDPAFHIAGAIVGGAAVSFSFRRKRRPKDPLDAPLLHWTEHDTFTVRDCLRSVEIKGITGSGKTSGSGDSLTNAIVAHPRSTMFIIGQKPEDKADVQKIYQRYGKLDKLIVIEPGCKWRMNFMAEVMKNGDPLAGVEFLNNQAEALDGGKGLREGERFWKSMQDRIIYNTLSALKLGGQPITATNMGRFLNGAATRPEQLRDENWREGFHNQTLRAAFNRTGKSPMEENDTEHLMEAWTKEWVNMDEKPRSSALAGVMNILHVFSTGLVNEMCSGETNVTFDAIDRGFSFFINFAYSETGPTGRFIAGGLKYLLQRWILNRHAAPGDYFNVLWLDEYQQSATEFDAQYISMCRSHLGGMVCLTQTVEAEYAAIPNKHRAAQLLSNYGHHIYHTVDPTTAKAAADLLGQRREDFMTYSPNPQATLGDIVLGAQAATWSMNQQYAPILQTSVLTGGLLSGGKANRNIVTGIVIRAGEPFRSTGENYIHVSFVQLRK